MTIQHPIQNCPVCNNENIYEFLKINQVPIHCNLLWPDRTPALMAPKGDIFLGFCSRCGHVFNTAFDSTLMEYNQAYENSLHFSPRFQTYAESLAGGLVERHALHNKQIVELGAGQGDFLRLLCSLGSNKGWGFDAAYVPPDEEGENGQVTFIQDFEWRKYFDQTPDMVCSRHVLEHIEHPKPFIDEIRHAVGDREDTLVFFEMPNMAYTLRALAIWDIIYEHCGYYTPQSISYLFQSSGFQVIDVHEVFADQFLTIEALPAPSSTSHAVDLEPDLQLLKEQVTSFADEYRSKVSFWQQELQRWADEGKRVVAWGAGSKGITFLNTLQTADQIAYIVDINPRKKGMFVVGSGQEIVVPEFLREYKPNVVILMNPVYIQEIKGMMAEMGLDAEFVVA